MPVQCSRGTQFNAKLHKHARERVERTPRGGVMDAELNAYDALGLSFESNPDDATIRKVRRRERDASSFFHCISFVHR